MVACALLFISTLTEIKSSLSLWLLAWFVLWLISVFAASARRHQGCLPPVGDQSPGDFIKT
jgi:hypothetical protein